MRFIDLTGRTYGRLIVYKHVAPVFSAGRNQHRWLCTCSCGRQVIVRGVELRMGDTRSCGCLYATHGKSKTKEYASWMAMLHRCYSPKAAGYKNYGAQGITVCKRWNKFENFLADMGPRPKATTLDRINNDRGYMPSNCRWATWEVQGNNRSNSVYITLNDQIKTLTEWSRDRICVVKYQTLRTRVNNGWPIYQALITPPRN